MNVGELFIYNIASSGINYQISAPVLYTYIDDGTALDWGLVTERDMEEREDVEYSSRVRPHYGYTYDPHMWLNRFWFSNEIDVWEGLAW